MSNDNHMLQLIELLAQNSPERATLNELTQIVKDRGEWPKARALFDRIRSKTNKAHHAKDETLMAQYAFEEACAKTLYNLTRGSSPFDPDAPYWIVPRAIVAARRLGIHDSQVLAIVAP